MLPCPTVYVRELMTMRLLFLSAVLLCPSALTAQDVVTTASSPASEFADGPPSVQDLLESSRDAALKKWSRSIDAFDTLNTTETDPADAVLFIGSSSIRRWETMAADMAPYSTIRRGYGGAKYTDMAVFVDRIVTPHTYRAIVMFVGNGVVGKPDGHTPEMIETLTRHIVDVAHRHQPQSPFFLIEITPCQKRFDAWPKIRAVNARLREVALTTPNTYFIPTAGHYLNADGSPRSELFVSDQLHLNEAGYQLWASLIRRHLNDFLPAADDSTRSE